MFLTRFLLPFLLLLLSRTEILRISLQKTRFPTDYTQNRSFVEKLHASVSNMRLTNYHDMQYYGPVQFGSQRQTFNMVFDTGSNWIFLPSSSCSTCVASHTYSCSDSKTCVVPSAKSLVNITYGKGFISGQVTYDQIYLSDELVVSGQKMLSVVYQKDFEGFSADGLVGMGVESFFDSSDQTNFVRNLFKAGKISNQMFSFKLSQESVSSGSYYSELVIGGYDNSSFAENITFFKVVNPQYWSIAMDQASADGTVLASNEEALLDTGTSIIVIPYTAFFNFATLLKKKHQCSVELNYIQCACPDGNTGSFPTFKFKFSGKEYTLEPEYYITQIRNLCIVNVGSLASFSDMWILGDKFMHKHYTVFDGGNLSIGLAAMNIPPSGSPTTLTVVLIVIIIVAGLLIAGVAVCLLKKFCLNDRSERRENLLQIG